MILFDVNYWAILVSALAGMFVGFFWYSKTFFGNAWIKATGISTKDMNKSKQKNMIGTMLLGFIVVFVMAFVLSNLIIYIGASGFLEGMQVGALVWLGFLATTMLNSFLWECKPFKLWIINAGHYLVVLLIMGAILGFWS